MKVRLMPVNSVIALLVGEARVASGLAAPSPAQSGRVQVRTPPLVEEGPPIMPAKGGAITIGDRTLAWGIWI
jgi:hypothetical protein